jgi:hypothetical protein
MAERMTIQRFPKGLLDWLGMKGSGDTPHELGTQLASVMDIGQLYLLDRAAFQNGSTSNISTNGIQTPSTTNFTVPAGELWAMKNFTMSKYPSFAAATGGTFRLGYYRSLVGQYFAFGPEFVIPAAGGGVLAYQFRPDELYLTPGDFPVVFTYAGVWTTPSPVTLLIEYSRLTT